MKGDENMQFMLDIMSSHHQIIQQNSKNTHFEHFWEFSKNIFFKDLRNRTNILVDCYFFPDSWFSERVLIALKFL